MTQPVAAKRSNYLDFVKGIAIIMVVIGHNIQYGSVYSINNSFYENSIFKFIYSFHMPLFMLISGYLFYFSTKKYSFKYNIKRRLFSLVIPILVWANIYLLYKMIIHYNEFGFLKSYAIMYNFKAVWFLWAIFWCSIVILFVNKFGKDKLYIYIILFVIMFFIPAKLNTHLYIYMFPFFTIGYLFNKYSLCNIVSKISQTKLIGILLISIISYSLLYKYLSQHFYIYQSGTCIIRKTGILDWKQFYIDLYRYLIGFVGSLIILIGIYLLDKIIYTKNHYYIKNSTSFVHKMIEKAGIKSLGIYVISEPLLNTILIKNIPHKEELGYWGVCIETVLIVCIAYFMTSLIEKNKFLSNLLFGGR